MENSGRLYESLGLQSFKTITDIQSKLNIFEELRLVKTFLINLGVLRMLWILILVLEGKVIKKYMLKDFACTFSYICVFCRHEVFPFSLF